LGYLDFFLHSIREKNHKTNRMTILEMNQGMIRNFGNHESVTSHFFSPGRVNLIGEHTDYNGGYVFPCALSFGTHLAIRKNNSNLIRLATGNFDLKKSIQLNEISQKVGKEWINYPLGVLNQFMQRGNQIGGVDMYYYGSIPNGAGLSSSASIEMVTAYAINQLFDFGYPMIELIKLSQKAENEFVGVNCGIMDQFAVGMGKKDHAIFLDCNSLEYELVPVQLNGYKLIISNTNKRRGLADSKYNERRSECDKAVEYLNRKLPIKLLGQITSDEFVKYQQWIPDETVRRRARHVVTEIQRVQDAVKELKEGNLLSFGHLMNESHDSLRYDYEVTGIELDTLVDEARRIEGTIGSRMTGAGFGGCTVSLVAEDYIEEFKKVVAANYEARTGLKADIYVADIGDGTRELERQ
jgi:galactokinase